MTYLFGRMKLTLNEDKRTFTLTGDVFPNDGQSSDHFQLIYEALEIAAHSKDKFNPEFADMVAEWLEQSKDWTD